MHLDHPRGPTGPNTGKVGVRFPLENLELLFVMTARGAQVRVVDRVGNEWDQQEMSLGNVRELAEALLGGVSAVEHVRSAGWRWVGG